MASIIIHAEGVQTSHSAKAIPSGAPMKPAAWDLARGKTGVSVIPWWVTFRKQTLVISRECRSGDVEHRVFSHRIRVRKIQTDLDQAAPRGAARDSIPMVQGFERLSTNADKLLDGPPADHAHQVMFPQREPYVKTGSRLWEAPLLRSTR